MNPIDHPHGGGEGKTSGGRPSVTPCGKITKGQPTKKNKLNKIKNGHMLDKNNIQNKILPSFTKKIFNNISKY